MNRPACRPRLRALLPDTRNETVALIKQRLAAQEPNHRDRVELIGIGYHWPNICLIHGCEHVFGHNPLRLKWFYDATRRRHGRGAGQRPFLAALSVLSLGVCGSVRRAPDRDRRAGRADRQVAQARRPEFRRAHQGRLRLRKSARAAARDDGGRLAGRGFRQADASGWPPESIRQDRAVGKGTAAQQLSSFEARHCALVRYRNTEVVVEVDSPPAACWCSTTSGIRGGARRSTASRPRSCAPTSIFRAVQVPPGKFTVRFTFAPFRGAWKELRARLRGN
jgi:hypothetical protein